MKSNFPTWLLPRTRDIFFIGIFLAVLVLGNQMLNLDGDLPRHLLLGKYIVQSRQIPTAEIFIYPYLNQPYVSHEWLTDVLFYLVYASWGWAGLVVLSALLLATTFTLLYHRLANRLNLRLPVLLLIAWGLVATSLNWAVRPHLVSMCLLALWLLWIDDVQRGNKFPVWLFPVSMIFWSNLHGEFIAGILLLLAYAVGWVLEYLLNRPNTNLVIGKNIWIAFLSSIIASLINPSGVGPWLSIFGFVNNQYLMSRMVEARPPNFQTSETQVLLALFAFSIFLLSVKREKLSAGQGLALAGFSTMSLIATRNIHLYGVVAPFLLAETLIGVKSFPLIRRLESSLQHVENKVQGMVWSAIFVIVLSFMVISNQRANTSYELKEPAFPIRAVEWLEHNPLQGNMFNDLNWGGYLGWRLWPDQLAFVDSMADTTGSLTLKYEQVITLHIGWQEIFNQYNITWAIIPVEWPLAKELAAQGWETAYQDQTAIILVKSKQ